MTHQTSFVSNDAKVFLEKLQLFKETLEKCLSKVLTLWQTLEASWRDSERLKFESIFKELLTSYNQIQKELDAEISFVSHQIKIAASLEDFKLKHDSFSSLEKLSAVVQLITTVAAPSVNAPNQVDITQNLEQHYESSYEQKIKERNDELDRNSIAYAQPTISGSPPDPKTQFANSLDYKAKKTTWNDGETTIRIDAYNSNGADIGAFLNARIQSDGRVHISDTVVGDAHKKQGIATKMLQTLESQLPNGTELYFIENQAEGYWEKKGFNPRQLNDGKIEYYKKVSRE